MNIVVDALMPVFLIIALGVVLKRTLLRSDAEWDSVERLTYFVLFPALLIVTTATADLKGAAAGRIAAVLLISVFVMSALLLSLRPFLARRFAISGAAFTTVFQTTTRWNTYIALAIAGALYGANGLALIAVCIIAMVPLLNVINVGVLALYASEEKLDARATIGHILRNPLIWSCLIGLTLNLSGLLVPKFLVVFGDILGRASLALGLVLVGAGLDIDHFVKPSAGILIATFLKLVVMPTLAIGLGIALGLSGTSLAIIAIASSVPAASAVYILARQMGGDAPLAASILAFRTAADFVTITIA